VAAAVQAEGLKKLEAAALLGISDRTLRRWEGRNEAHRGPHCMPRGRAVRRSPVDLRNLAAWTLDVLEALGCQLTLRGLWSVFEEMPRSELTDIHDRYRRIQHHLHPPKIHTLTWPCPGSVWAMDHAVAPAPVDGIHPQIFALRDLSSGLTLCWEPVETASSRLVIASCEEAFLNSGLPLVIKSDNGSAFISEDLRDFLDSRGVKLLLSPVRKPQYNGSCEVGIRWLKTRSEREAMRLARPGRWRHEDMERAAFLSNHLPRRGGLSPQARWDARAAITPEARAAFLQTLQAERPKVLQDLGLSGKSELTTLEERQVERHSIRRALVARGYLSFRRRTLPLQQKFQKADTR
jgi:transposase InsO family protein